MDSGRGRAGRNRNVFKGSVLVSILLESHPRRFQARASAAKFAKRLLREGVICSIFGSRSFEDSAQLYMWQDDDAIRRHRATMTSSGSDGVTATTSNISSTTASASACHTTATTPSPSSASSSSQHQQQQQQQERLIREAQQRAGYESLRRVEEAGDSEPRYERLDSRLIEDVKRRVLNRSEAYNIVTSYNTFFQELQRDFVASSETGGEKEGSEHNYYNEPLPPRQQQQQQQQQHHHHHNHHHQSPQQQPQPQEPGDRVVQPAPPPYHHRTAERQQEALSGGGSERDHRPRLNNKSQQSQQHHHHHQQYPPPSHRPRRHDILPETSHQVHRQHHPYNSQQQEQQHQQQQQQQQTPGGSSHQQHQTYRATPHRQYHPHHAAVPPKPAALSSSSAAVATAHREPAHRHQQQLATPTTTTTRQTHHHHRNQPQPGKPPQGQVVTPHRPRDPAYSAETAAPSSYQDPTYASVGGVADTDTEADADAKRESTCSTDSSLDTQTYFRTRDRISTSSKAPPQGGASATSSGKNLHEGGVASSSSGTTTTSTPNQRSVTSAGKSPHERGGVVSGKSPPSSSSQAGGGTSSQGFRAGDAQSSSVTPRGVSSSRSRPSTHHQRPQAGAALSKADPPARVARSHPVARTVLFDGPAYPKMATTTPLAAGPAQSHTPPQQQAPRGGGDHHLHLLQHHSNTPGERSSDPSAILNINGAGLDGKDRGDLQLLRPEMTSSSDYELTSAGMPGAFLSHHLHQHLATTATTPGGGGLTSSSSNRFESSSSPEHMALASSAGMGMMVGLGGGGSDSNHLHHLNHNHHRHHHSSSSNSQPQGSGSIISSSRSGGGAGGGGVTGGGASRGWARDHDATVACSYSDNEKQLIEEMKRMKKEHQDILRTYEGRINKLMAKMHELRNIAEMLENSSTSKVAPYGLLPAKATLLNIIASGTKLDDGDKKGLTSSGEADVPPPLPPRPGRGGRVYPNKPILHARTRMKSLLWNRIILGEAGTEGNTTSVWHGMTEAKFENQEVERLYSSPPDSASDDVTLLDDIYAARGRPKHQLIAMFDAERSQRVLTEMRNLRCTLNDVINAISSLDCHHLHQDSFAELLELLNCPRDVDKILHHVKRKGPGQLDTAEFLIFEMSKLDHFRERLEFLRFKNKLQINLFEIDQQLRELNTACDELVNNLPLKNVLETVLAVGNYLNAGTERGQADGFGLDILNKLKDFADRTRRGNLLELIMRTYCLQYEADLDLGCPTRFRLPEPSNMRHAAQVSFEEIQKALRDLREELSQVRDRLEVLSKRETSNLTIALRVTSENFLTSAVEVLAEEKRFLEDTKGHFWKTASYFLYNRQCTPQEFFQTWATFLHDCKYYWKLAHRNLARDKFERDFSTKCQLSCSSLPGFTNLKNKMMRTVETLQNDQEMRVSKAQQLQHINNWIESLGKYDQELEGGGHPQHQHPHHQGAPPPQPHGVVRDNTYGNDLGAPADPASGQYGDRRGRPPQRQNHSAKHKDLGARGGGGGGGSHPQHQGVAMTTMMRSSSPKPITSTPPNVHKPQAISHASPATVSSTYSSASFPNNNNNVNDVGGGGSGVPVIAPYASSGDNFLLLLGNNNYHHQPYLSDGDGIADEPYESLNRATMAMVSQQQQQQQQQQQDVGVAAGDAVPAADSVDGGKVPRSSQDNVPGNSSSNSSSKKKPNLSLKSWLKRDQRHHHRSSNDELSSSQSPAAAGAPPPSSSAAVAAPSSSSSPSGGTAAKSQPAQVHQASPTTTATTPFNKLRNTVVQKFSGGGSSKKSNDASKGSGSKAAAASSGNNNNTNTTNSGGSPAVPPKPPRTMVDSADLPQSHQILFTSPGIKQMQDNQLPADFDPTDYQNFYYQAADRSAERGGYPLPGSGPGGEGRGGYPSGHDSAPSTLSSAASRECSPLKYEAFARGAEEASRHHHHPHRDRGQRGDDAARYGSQDWNLNLNPPSSSETLDQHHHQRHGRSGGGGRNRAPIALNLGSNMSISDAYGRNEDQRQPQQQQQQQQEAEDTEVQYTNDHVEGGGRDAVAVAPNNSHHHQQQQPLLLPPQPGTVDSKRVKAVPVPVYKAKLIPNYENQTKMTEPRHLDHAIRGQAEPVPLPLSLAQTQTQTQSQSPQTQPASAAGHFAQSSNSSEVYRQELQRKSEMYVTSYPQSPLSQQASPNNPPPPAATYPSPHSHYSTTGLHPPPANTGSPSPSSSSIFPHSGPNQAFSPQQTPPQAPGSSPSASSSYPPPPAPAPVTPAVGATYPQQDVTSPARDVVAGGPGPVNSASPHYDDFQTPVRRSLSAQNILDRGGTSVFGSDGSRQSHTSEPTATTTTTAPPSTHSYLASFTSRKDESPAPSSSSWRDNRENNRDAGKPEAPNSAPAKVSALISRWEQKDAITAIASSSSAAAAAAAGAGGGGAGPSLGDGPQEKPPSMTSTPVSRRKHPPADGGVAGGVGGMDGNSGTSQHFQRNALQDGLSGSSNNNGLGTSGRGRGGGGGEWRGGGGAGVRSKSQGRERGGERHRDDFNNPHIHQHHYRSQSPPPFRYSQQQLFTSPRSSQTYPYHHQQQQQHHHKQQQQSLYDPQQQQHHHHQQQQQPSYDPHSPSTNTYPPRSSAGTHNTGTSNSRGSAQHHQHQHHHHHQQQFHNHHHREDLNRNADVDSYSDQLRKASQANGGGVGGGGMPGEGGRPSKPVPLPRHNIPGAMAVVKPTVMHQGAPLTAMEI